MFRKGKQRKILLEEVVDEGAVCRGLRTPSPQLDPTAPVPSSFVPTAFPWKCPFPDQQGDLQENCGRCSSNLLPDGLKEKVLSVLRFKQKCFIPPNDIFLKTHKTLIMSCGFLIRTYSSPLTIVLELLLKSRSYILSSFIALILQCVLLSSTFHMIWYLFQLYHLELWKLCLFSLFFRLIFSISFFCFLILLPKTPQYIVVGSSCECLWLCYVGRRLSMAWWAVLCPRPGSELVKPWATEAECGNLATRPWGQLLRLIF